MNDWELIQSYCRSGSESAFETLVKRHVDYVYCAALRQVRDPSLAEDVAQAVFLLLARKAKSFRSGTVLVSWLFRTTHFIASRALRSEYRRQRRELEAATMNPTTTTPENDLKWELVSPLLDEALAALPSKDRDAVLLRFISCKPFSQVGAEIGASEDAAKKRVTRALARLREFFVRRGTTLSVAAIGVMLGERLVQASPAALATKITAAMTAGGSGAASASAAALLRASLRELFWTRVQRGAAISAGLLAVLYFATMASRSAHDKVVFSTSATPELASIGSNRMAAENIAIRGTIATKHTLSLLVARAEDGQPVAVARVLVAYWKWRELERTLDATTDTNGLLEIPIPAQAFSILRIFVAAENRVPMVINWQSHEFNEPVLAHTVLLEPGQAAVGTVLDESGNPVSGAKVYFQGGSATDFKMRDRVWFHYDLSASFTDANGRWRTTQLPASPSLSQIKICVTHPDFTPAQPRVSELPGFPTNAILVLSNGVALGGHVLAEDGSPVANARVAKLSGAYLSTNTDLNGYFYWPHVEPGQLSVYVDAEGFEIFKDIAWATNAVNNCAFTLSPSSNRPSSAPVDGPRVRLRGTVVDADTGQAIPSFRVFAGGMLELGSSTTLLPDARLLGEGRDGRFDWQVLPDAGQPDWRALARPGPQLQVEADGYLASISKVRVNDSPEQEFNFRLRREVVLIGRVVTPNGSPAENAVVNLTGLYMGATMLTSGQWQALNPEFEKARTRTDRHGKFHLNLITGATGVVIAHESGTALLTLVAATNDVIVLQPWGAIDGTLYLNGQLASNQIVLAHGMQKLDADPRVYFMFSYQTNTDERGSFRFERVPPCEASVDRERSFFSWDPAFVDGNPPAKVKVESGVVASVEMRGQGRPVIGRVVFEGSPGQVLWSMSTASLQGGKVYPFALSQDGSLHADNVPPGTYKLSIQLANSSIERWDPSSPPIGSLQKEVVVPPTKDQSVPVDLGELTVTRAKAEGEH